jgi:hypothetical protein
MCFPFVLTIPTIESILSLAQQRQAARYQQAYRRRLGRGGVAVLRLKHQVINELHPTVDRCHATVGVQRCTVTFGVGPSALAEVGFENQVIGEADL